MRPRQRAPRPQDSSRAIRRRYVWHLRRPFRDQFDRSHWWKNRSKVEPAAALYELVRRHPDVRAGWLRAVRSHRKNNRAIKASRGGPTYTDTRFSRLVAREHWFPGHLKPGELPVGLSGTCLFGLKSWDKLDYTDRENWKCYARHLKGIDFRPTEDVCCSVDEVARWKIRFRREDKLEHKPRKTKPSRAIGDLVNADLAANPPTAKEWEAAIAESAVEAYRRGDLLFALAPDLTAKQCGSYIESLYSSTRKRFGKPKQRSRWQDWLPLIEAFEDGDTAYSQTFARYRRAVDSVRFA